MTIENEHFAYAIAAITALLASWLATPLVRAWARQIGFVDRPDGGRKSQKVPIALGGGLAVFSSTLFAFAVATSLGTWSGIQVFSPADVRLFLGLLLAAGMIVGLGIYDDFVAMRGRYKFAGQIVVALIMVAAGLRIEQFFVFGNKIALGWFTIPFTMFWVLGSINAINLIDGIDGLASSVGMVLSLAVGAIGCMMGHFPEAILMLALAGALGGFLRYNFAPATIYLGDAGSMLIGLLIGVIAIPTTAKAPIAIGLAVPIAVWSIPILDSAAAILRRKLTGRSLFAPDRGHLHHSLLTRGWSVRQVALFIALICGTTCLSAVLSVIWRNELIAFFTVGAVLVFLVLTKTFGHIEVALIRDRFRHTNLPFQGNDRSAAGNRHSSFHLQGSREWDKLWAAIVESAEDYQLTKLKLSINIPAVNESFYASWASTRVGDEASDRVWKVSTPLTLDGQNVGKFDISGAAEDAARSTFAQMIQVLDFLEPIEEDIRQVREQIELDHDSVLLRQAAVKAAALRSEATKKARDSARDSAQAAVNPT